MTNQVTSHIMRVTSPQVAEPAPETWSNCLVVNGVAYISGMVARGNDGKVVAGTVVRIGLSDHKRPYRH